MTTRFGRFEVVRKLASGGMGEVSLVREGAGPLRVLKRILPHLSQNQDFLDHFLDEARIAARLIHPNVAQVLELGDAAGEWYLLMEYVAGRDLRQVAMAARRKHKSVPLGVVCRIVAGAAAGLDCAHRLKDVRGRPMNVVHRDVSPQNVLVSFAGEVKVIDVGVAAAASRLPREVGGALVGKFPYMSPEQVAGKELDHRSDQFSLGVILWELLTGQRLFKADSDLLTLERVAECDVALPTRDDEDLPRALEALVMRALQREPENRFADLAGIAAELEEVLTAQPWTSSEADVAAFMELVFPGGVDGQEPDSGSKSGERAPPRGKTSRSAEKKARAAQGQAPMGGGAADFDAVWPQLQDHEQCALAQLSVFEGDFSLEAAEAVISLAAFPAAPWALDVVQVLRERALLAGWDSPVTKGELRFGLPEEVRAAALEKLRSMGAQAEQEARQRLARVG